MFGVSVKSSFESKAVTNAVDSARARILPSVAFHIQKAAQDSFERSPEPSPAGTPPHTRDDQLPKAILYASEGEIEVVGPAFSLAGDSGHPHEFGGEFRGAQYDARPFMLPALKQNLDLFASSWNGSVSS